MKKILAKAIEIDNDFIPTGKITIIELTEEEHKKYRIIEELACMSLETYPLLNPKEENKGKPFILWNSEDFENEENNKINEILDQKNKEFEDILSEKLGLSKEEKDSVFFGDQFNPNSKDKEDGIVLVFEYSVHKEEEKKGMTVNDLIKKLNELPEELKEAEINISIEDEDGSSIGYPLHNVSEWLMDEEDEMDSFVDLSYSEFNEAKSEQERIQNIESGDLTHVIEVYRTSLGEVKVYQFETNDRQVHIVTPDYSMYKKIVKEVVDGEEI